MGPSCDAAVLNGRGRVSLVSAGVCHAQTKKLSGFGLAAVAFFGYLAHTVLPNVSVLYMGYRYGWGTATVGLTLAGVGVAVMIVQGG